MSIYGFVIAVSGGMRRFTRGDIMLRGEAKHLNPCAIANQLDEKSFKYLRHLVLITCINKIYIKGNVELFAASPGT